MLQSIKKLTLFEKLLWLFSVIIIVISFSLTGEKDTLTLFASLIGVTALIFIAKGDVLGQVLTLLFGIIYAIISFRFRYYGEMITYLGMTAPIAILSIVTWIKNPYAKKQVRVKHFHAKNWFLLLGITCLVTACFYFILKALENENLFISTISIATSFSASALMMFRCSYYAIAYALNDIVLIALWILATIQNISFFPMILCFIMFFINDIYGFINWRKMEKEQRDSP